MMTHWNSIHRTAGAGGRLAVFLVLLFSAATSHATLSASDLVVPGDGLLLLDSETNLEWLDLTETTGLSFDDLTTGNGPADYISVRGFRFATTAEVGLLWSHAGIVDSSGASHAGNRAAAEFLLTMMGCTASCATAGRVHQGQAEFSPGQSLLNGPYLFLTGGGEAIAALDPGFTQSRDFSSASLGNYLVRNSVSVVPEPSAALLIALGVAGLSAHRRGTQLLLRS